MRTPNVELTCHEIRAVERALVHERERLPTSLPESFTTEEWTAIELHRNLIYDVLSRLSEAVERHERREEANRKGGDDGYPF